MGSPFLSMRAKNAKSSSLSASEKAACELCAGSGRICGLGGFGGAGSEDKDDPVLAGDGGGSPGATGLPLSRTTFK
jgi:hypothetical protein